RGSDAHAGAGAPAARGRAHEGSHLGLQVACRQTFSRTSRLERGGKGRVRLSGSGANQRGRRRGIVEAATAFRQPGPRTGRIPLASRGQSPYSAKDRGRYVV